MPLKLTPDNVYRVLCSCFFKDGELDGLTPEQQKARALIVEGVMHTLGLDPVKVATARSDIDDLLDQTPEVFEKGMTFLEFCADREGKPWAGFHKSMDELLMLGLAIGRAEYCLPREMWNVFPAGLPYFIVRPRNDYTCTLTMVMH